MTADPGEALPSTITADQKILGAVIGHDPVLFLWVQSAGNHPDVVLPLPLIGEFSIGRAGTVVIDRPEISRVHVQATRLGTGLTLRLPTPPAKNGVMVRGVRLEPGGTAAISPGESWALGTTAVVALTAGQARGRDELAHLLGPGAATRVLNDSAVMARSFGIVTADPVARRAVALAVADVSLRRSERRAELWPESKPIPRDRDGVRAFAERAASGIAIVDHAAVEALPLTADDRNAWDRYLTDGARQIQLLWCADSEADVRARLGVVADRLSWITVPTVAERARAGALPGMLAQALQVRGSPLTLDAALGAAKLDADVLAAYEWPDGLRELHVCVEVMVDAAARMSVAQTAARTGLTRFALRRLVQTWQGGGRGRRRGLLGRMFDR